eukprot:TRINITY_DN4958_c0_g1_i1.p1 TRINITY_DN4958_c0_g1~~TRINITY_DN4958_c0_g1_i1.p1  ORF type:complete len:354 (+),score=85.89 TRINITY_DN4958_c0_g1_i1:28-1089(+)
MAKERKERVYQHVAWLDNTLTVLYIILVGVCIAVYKDDTVALIELILCCVGAYIGINVCHFTTRKVGRWVSRNYLQSFGDPLGNDVTLEKFCAQMWQFVVHTSMTIVEIYVIHDEVFLTDPIKAVDMDSFKSPPKTSLKLMILTQLGIWIYTAYSHRFVETRKKDYYVMYIHHVLTIFLVIASAGYGYYASGLIVLFFHDMSDIPIDSLKLFNLLKLDGKKGFYATEISFFVNMAFWIVCRMICFPLMVIYPSSKVALSDTFDHENTSWNIYVSAILGLCVLYALHCWWFWLMIRLFCKYALNTESANEVIQDGYEGDDKLAAADKKQKQQEQQQQDGEQPEDEVGNELKERR